MQNKKLELIIGKNLADVLVENNAAFLIENIKKLRKESKRNIPLIHITDEIEISENTYEIRNFNRKTLRQITPKDKNLNSLTEDIIRNLDELCKNKH